MLNQIAGWIAPAATMLAALMTAANLGSRITGWGFVVFTVGSISWSVVAITSNQPNLLWTNGLLILVNLLGVWRWLGRQARFDDGAAAAAEESRDEGEATLTAISRIVGTTVVGRDEETLGRVVDAMVRCRDGSIAYFVVSDGGLAGVGETLYAMTADEAELCEADVRTSLALDELTSRRPLEKDGWPAVLSSAHRGAG